MATTIKNITIYDAAGKQISSGPYGGNMTFTWSGSMDGSISGIRKMWRDYDLHRK